MGNQNKITSYLDHLYALDYRERPVTMDEFLENEEYFGKLTERHIKGRQ
jgi:hypothetical protein